MFRDSSKILGAFVRFQRTINVKIGHTEYAIVIRKKVGISKEEILNEKVAEMERLSGEKILDTVKIAKNALH